MATIHSSAFVAEMRPKDVVEGQIRGDSFDVQMHYTRWLSRGEGIFQPSMTFIQMFLGASVLKGSYQRGARPSDYAAMGDIALIPEGSPLYCSWIPGSQRCISCMFDMDALAQRTAMEWRWPEFDHRKALDIRNEYVRAGLGRIAEEVLSPGFASDTQIECSLLFVASELRRHFDHDRRDVHSSVKKLTAGQLDLLRGRVIDSPRFSPSVAELARSCGLNGRQLALAYRRTTGLTLRSFIANARLERAKILLLDGRTLVKQVAYDTGFQGAAAFTAAFRKATGMTPVEFRAKLAARRLH